MKELKFVKQLLSTVNDLSLPLFFNKKHVVCKKCKVHKTSKCEHTRNYGCDTYAKEVLTNIFKRMFIHEISSRDETIPVFGEVSFSVYTFLPR